jgi:hypothetical protein
MLSEKLQALAQGQQPQSMEELFASSKEGMMADKVMGNVRIGMSQEKEMMMAEMDALISQKVQDAVSQIRVRNGIDGKDGKPGRPGKDAEIPEIPVIKEEDVVAKVLEKIPKQPLNRRGGSGGGGGSTVITDDLSSQANGSTYSFSTTKTIGTALIVASTQFPTILRPTVDYTTSGTTLTLNSSLEPIQTGQTLIVVFVEG